MSTTNLIGANNQRLSFAAAAASTTPSGGSSTAKTPDYHLPWTGPVVEAALQKIIDLDLSKIGGIKVLDSSVTEPFDLDTLVDIGNYTTTYVVDTLFPDDIKGSSPVNVSVFTKDGYLFQLIETMGNRYARFSDDSGTTWSVLSPKINNGPIDTSDPSTPAKDPIDDLADRVEALENGAGSLKLGTVEDAKKMINGTYVYPD